MSIRNLSAASAAILICLMAAPARADHRPVIAVPGNPHVPVVVDGIDASFAVVTGEWGLYAPGRVAVEIYRPPFVMQAPARGYYPGTGRRPRYGREEIIVPRRVLPEAPSFYREWTVGPGTGPVTEYPPFDPPEITVEPRDRRLRR